MDRKVKEPKITKELGVGKDGYQTGGVEIKATDPMESQVVDPRSEKSFRGKSYIAKGDSNPVKGTGAARKQKDVTWY